MRLRRPVCRMCCSFSVFNNVTYTRRNVSLNGILAFFFVSAGKLPVEFAKFRLNLNRRHGETSLVNETDSRGGNSVSIAYIDRTCAGYRGIC